MKNSSKTLIAKINNVPVYLIRKKVKNINFTFKPDVINISAPYSTPINEIQDLLEKKYLRIGKTLREVQKRDSLSKINSHKTVNDFTHFILFGQTYPIVYKDNLKTIELRDGKLNLPFFFKDLDSQTYLVNINDFVKEKLSEYINQRLDYWYKKTGLECSKFTIRKMKTRWGSCTYKTKRIRFNLLLALFPKEVIDSVIIHELCHLEEPNHQKDFYELLYKYDPDYNEQNQVLKKAYIPEIFVY